MQKNTTALAVTLLVAAGCTAPTVESSTAQTSLYPIPDAVVALAGPNQDLTTATLVAEDDCYWYYHVGPVERTLVPLRAANGNHICNARQS
ncbi:hypothetical protein [Paracoccus marcusii]|uniref:hypothetical protein n=1 Tax=Paracoccus marcusii TaxID=59779 RepID=UPI00111269BB|nr:hypothetical protein [Paracoccus marcusii]TNC04184.1 hypothetical protein FHD68_06540 [Paracoccus marcusii]